MIEKYWVLIFILGLLIGATLTVPNPTRDNSAASITADWIIFIIAVSLVAYSLRLKRRIKKLEKPKKQINSKEPKKGIDWFFIQSKKE